MIDKSKRIVEIDFIKGYAIIAIIIFHLISVFMVCVPTFFRIASNFGGAGVHAFIICSGFALYYSYKRVSLKFLSFIKKRLSKIYLPYVIVVTITAIVTESSVQGYSKFEVWLSHVLLYKMFIPELNESYGYQLWFVSTIIQFYVVFLVLVKIKVKMSEVRFLTTCCLTSLLWAILVAIIGKSDMRVWNSFFLQYLWEFAVGMVIVDHISMVKRFIQEISYITLSIFALVGIVLLGVTGVKGGILKGFNDFPSVIAFISIGLILYKTNIFTKLFIWISAISYEWYLVHILIFSIIYSRVRNNIKSLIIDIVFAIVSFAISCLTAVLFSKLYSYIKKVMIDRKK